ncbi:hypothetical protein HYH03_005782 [Edaphochlamys debaryana]|uniref:Uncharacterized protein n=1 Tax=Edaphochlamys debaryana TaxID=47281 RepID=A0A836C1T5_9CHLO|nr:hypothetical protein HYH03_005782 [Edaphochlamys debaryana]|eukprot:KAG2496182.1 hypothetical protein HYH03_005782 [Edaphochlamys debaryana]
MYGAGRLQLQRDLLGSITFEAAAATVPLPPATETAGLPIVCKYNRMPSNGQLLAVGGEEGFVTVVNTDRVDTLQSRVQDGTWRPRAHWLCHRNSIFDLAWAKGDSVLYTASGHQHVGVWDVETSTALAVAEGHEGSVKAVAPMSLCEDVFATGSRDGRIMLWDARVASGRGAQAEASRLAPVWVQDLAHTRLPAGASRSKAAKGNPTTVTTVAFLPASYMLLSGGAQDTAVKLWDLRMRGLPLCGAELPSKPTGRGKGKAAAGAEPQAGVPHEVGSYAGPSRSSAAGVTHIAVTEAGDRLIVSCVDSQHHLYSASGLLSGPLASWQAPAPAFRGTFYQRSAFSPCGDYVLCGSKDVGAHIWSTAAPERPAVQLPHEHEVTGVAWSASDWAQVATCSDSGEVRVWSLARLPAAEGPALPAQAAGRSSAAGGGAAETSHQLELEPEGAPVAVAAPVAVGLPPTPATAPKPASARRLVQTRINLARAARPSTADTTPVPSAPAPAPAAADPAAAGAEQGSPMGGVATAAAAAMEDGAVVSPIAGVAAVQPGATAAALRAGAVFSPSASPARPATGARRTGPLPPVPIFSPAVNRWQSPRSAALAQQPAMPGLPPLPPGDAAPASQPITFAPAGPVEAPAAAAGIAASAGAIAAAPVAVAGGLEAAMLGLPLVRTQSPVHIRPSQLPAPQQPEPQPEPQTQLAARVPAMSPRATPSGSARPRSRLGPFSPSHSAHSSGSVRSGSSSGGSGGSGGGGAQSVSTGHVRSASQGSGHQHAGAPQGVVGQIVRASPRRGFIQGYPAAGPEALFSLASASPRRGESPRQPPSDGGFGRGGGGSGGAGIGRQLFSQPDDSHTSHPPARSDDAAPATSVDRLLMSPRSRFHGEAMSMGQGQGNPGSWTPVRSPRPAWRPPTPVHIAFELHDGTDVGPALRHRALHPADCGPFDENILADAPSYGSDESDGGAPLLPTRRRPAARRASATGDGGAAAPRLDLFAGLDAAEAGAEVQGPGGEEAGGDFGGAWALARRGGGASSTGMALSDGAWSSDGDDIDWESDPYGDKENTPPPPELEEAAAPALPTASAGVPAGAPGTPRAAPAASPRSAAPAASRGSLPRLLAPVVAEPGGGDLRGGESLQSPTRSQRPAVPPSPFAAAPPFAAAAAAAAGPDARPDFAARSAPSLHSVPSVSAGVAPGPAVDRASREGSLEDREDGDGGLFHCVTMPSFGAALRNFGYTSAGSDDEGDGAAGGASGGDAMDTECDAAAARYAAEAAAALPPPRSVGRRSHPGTDAVGLAPRAGDNPTPLKKARRSYVFEDEAGGEGAFGSPPRDATSPLHFSVSEAALAAANGPTPTPISKSRPRTNAAAALASTAETAGPSAVPPSPFPRLVPSSCRKAGGGSRLGFGAAAAMATAAAGAALPLHAGLLGTPSHHLTDGSASPAPKVGTASRTGARTSAASKEFHRRRAEEARSERDGAVMSPFGFGLLSPSGAAAVLPPPPPAPFLPPPSAQKRGGPSLPLHGVLFGAPGIALSDGSASPAPKVGTASRTGPRGSEASKEFYRRRAEEARSERDGAVMSPFGFGLLSPSAAAQPPAPPPSAAASQPRSSRSSGEAARAEAAAAGPAADVARLLGGGAGQEGFGLGTRLRFDSPDDSPPGPNRTAAAMAAESDSDDGAGTEDDDDEDLAPGVRRLVLDPEDEQAQELLARQASGDADEQVETDDEEAEAAEEDEDEEMGLTLECSVRSLSVVFETQATQGGSTQVVPATFPEDGEEEGAEGAGYREAAAQRWGRPLPAEERTVASPALRAGDGDGDDDDGFELRSQGGDAMERHGSVNFGRLFGGRSQPAGAGAQHPHPQQLGQQQGRGGEVAVSEILPDESSRCFPEHGRNGSGGDGAAAGGWGTGFGAVMPMAMGSQSAPRQAAAAAPAAAAGGRMPPPPAPALPPARGVQRSVPEVFPELPCPTENVPQPQAVPQPRPAAQPHTAAGARKPRQQTLLQCWETTAPAPAQVHAPQQARQAGVQSLFGGLGPAGAQSPAARMLGPNGLTSPRYFR